MHTPLHPVAHWAFDAGTREIHAFDQNGRVLMAIASGPLFAARLAAAFSAPPAGQAPQMQPQRPLAFPL